MFNAVQPSLDCISSPFIVDAGAGVGRFIYFTFILCHLLYYYSMT